MKSEVEVLKQELNDLKEDLLKIHGKGWKRVVEIKLGSAHEKQQNNQNNNGSNRPST